VSAGYREDAIWAPSPEQLEPEDTWYRRCPACDLIVQWGAHGLGTHWDVVHRGLEAPAWEAGLIPGDTVPDPTGAQLSVVRRTVRPEAPAVLPGPPQPHLASVTALWDKDPHYYRRGLPQRRTRPRPQQQSLFELPEDVT
jgi:hypothetical protein